MASISESLFEKTIYFQGLIWDFRLKVSENKEKAGVGDYKITLNFLNIILHQQMFLQYFTVYLCGRF